MLLETVHIVGIKKSVHFQDDFQLVYMCILNTASAKAINL